MTLRFEPGWAGVFTRNQAEGAIPNGTRIRKCASEPGDAHPDGTIGTVLGSMPSPPELVEASGGYAYFVEWDPLPRRAVGITAYRIERAL